MEDVMYWANGEKKRRKRGNLSECFQLKKHGTAARRTSQIPKESRGFVASDRAALFYSSEGQRHLIKSVHHIPSQDAD